MSKAPCTPSRSRSRAASSTMTKTPTQGKTRSFRSTATPSTVTPSSAENSLIDGSPPRPPNAWILYRSYKLEQLKKAESQERAAGTSSSKKRCASPAKGSLTASALAALASVANESDNADCSSRPSTPSLASQNTRTTTTLWGTSSSSKTSSTGQSLGGPAAAAGYTPISTLLAQMWRSEPEEVKASFHDLAKTKEEEHKKMFPDYKYRPKETEKSRAARERRRRGGNGEPCSSLIDPARLPKSVSPSSRQRTVLVNRRSESPARQAARPYPASPRLQKDAARSDHTHISMAQRRSPRFLDPKISQVNVKAVTERTVSDSSVASMATIVDLGSVGATDAGTSISAYQVSLVESPKSKDDSFQQDKGSSIDPKQESDSRVPCLEGIQYPNVAQDETTRQLIASPRPVDADMMDWLTGDAVGEAGTLPFPGTDFDVLSSLWTCPSPCQVSDGTTGVSMVKASNDDTTINPSAVSTLQRTDEAASILAKVEVEKLAEPTWTSANAPLAPVWSKEDEELIDFLNQQSADFLCDSEVEDFLSDPRDKNVLPSEIKSKSHTLNATTSFRQSNSLSRDPHARSKSMSSTVGALSGTARFPRPRMARLPLLSPITSVLSPILCGPTADLYKSDGKEAPDHSKETAREAALATPQSERRSASDTTVSQHFSSDTRSNREEHLQDTFRLEYSEKRCHPRMSAVTSAASANDFDGTSLLASSPTRLMTTPSSLAQTTTNRIFVLHGSFTERELWNLLLSSDGSLQR